MTVDRKLLRDIIDEIMVLVQDNDWKSLDLRYKEIISEMRDLDDAVIIAWLRAAAPLYIGKWYDLRDAAIQEFERRGEDPEFKLPGIYGMKRPKRMLTKEQYEDLRAYHLGYITVSFTDITKGSIIGLTFLNKNQSIKYNQMCLFAIRHAYYNNRMWAFTAKDIIDKYPDKDAKK